VIRCVVESVRLHPELKNHVVVLRADSGTVLPIWIGPDSAAAIGGALTGSKNERPLTHDLLLSAFGKLGVRVARVGITGFVPYSDPTQTGGVFYATLYLEQGAERIEVDARPSDAIALAVRTGAPIDVDEAIFAKSSVKPAI
jgi:bifunctional DNase/RNase